MSRQLSNLEAETGFHRDSIPDDYLEPEDSEEKYYIELSNKAREIKESYNKTLSTIREALESLAKEKDFDWYKELIPDPQGKLHPTKTSDGFTLNASDSVKSSDFYIREKKLKEEKARVEAKGEESYGSIIDKIKEQQEQDILRKQIFYIETLKTKRAKENKELRAAQNRKIQEEKNKRAQEAQEQKERDRQAQEEQDRIAKAEGEEGKEEDTNDPELETGELPSEENSDSDETTVLEVDNQSDNRRTENPSDPPTPDSPYTREPEKKGGYKVLLSQIGGSLQEIARLANQYRIYEKEFLNKPSLRAYGYLEETWGSYCNEIATYKKHTFQITAFYPKVKNLIPGPYWSIEKDTEVEVALAELTTVKTTGGESEYSTPDTSPKSSPKPKLKIPKLIVGPKPINKGEDGEEEEEEEEEDDSNNNMPNQPRWSDLPRFDPKKHQENDPRSHMFDLKSFLKQHGYKIDFKPEEETAGTENCADIIRLFIASLQGRARDWFEYAFPESEHPSREILKDWLEFTAAFEKNYSLVGSTVVEQQQALRSLKWEPAKQSLDDFITTFIRLMRVMHIDSKTQVGIFSLAMPLAMYPLLAKEETLNGAIEQAKQGVIIGMGVTPMTPILTTPQPAPVEPAKPVPFMPINDPYIPSENRVENKMADSINVLTQTVDNLKSHLDDAMYVTASNNRGNYQPRFQNGNFQPGFQRNNYQNRPQNGNFQSNFQPRFQNRFQNGNQRGRGGFQRGFQGRGRGNFNHYTSPNYGAPRGGPRGGQNQGPGRNGAIINCDFCSIPGHRLAECRSLERLLENRGLRVGRKPNYDPRNPQRNNDRFQYINEAELQEFVNCNIEGSVQQAQDQLK